MHAISAFGKTFYEKFLKEEDLFNNASLKENQN